MGEVLDFVALSSPRRLKEVVGGAIEACQRAIAGQPHWSTFFEKDPSGGGSLGCGLIVSVGSADEGVLEAIRLRFDDLERLSRDNEGWATAHSGRRGQKPHVHVTCLALRAYRMHGRTTDEAYLRGMRGLENILARLYKEQEPSRRPAQRAPGVPLNPLEAAFAYQELAAAEHPAPELLSWLEAKLRSELSKLIGTDSPLSHIDLAHLSRVVDALWSGQASRPMTYRVPEHEAGDWQRRALGRVLSLVREHDGRIQPVQERIYFARENAQPRKDGASGESDDRRDNWAHLCEERALITLLRLGHPVLSEEVLKLTANILRRRYSGPDRDKIGLWYSELNPASPSVFACVEAVDALRVLREAIGACLPTVLVSGAPVQEAFIVEHEMPTSSMPRFHASFNEPHQMSWLPRAGGALLTARYLDEHAIVDLAPELEAWKSRENEDWSPRPLQLQGAARTYERQILRLARTPRTAEADCKDRVWRVNGSLLRQRCRWDSLGPAASPPSGPGEAPTWVLYDDYKSAGEVGADTPWADLDPGQRVLVKTNRPREIWDRLFQREGPSIIVADLPHVSSSDRARVQSWDAIVGAIRRALPENARSGSCVILLGGRWGCVMFGRTESAHVGWQGQLCWDLKRRAATLDAADLGWFAGIQNLFVSELVRALHTNGMPASHRWEFGDLCGAVARAWDVVRETIELGVDAQPGQGTLDSLGGAAPDLAAVAFRPRRPARAPRWPGGVVRIEPDGTLAPRRHVLLTALRVLTGGVSVLERGPSEKAQGDARILEDSLELRPVLRLKALVATQQQAINDLGYMAELIADYHRRSKDTRPLSIAVFGQPGSGKSFAVKQIANAVLPRPSFLEFNLSQFETPTQLLDAFHRVQSAALEGNFPVVFWDEFDGNDYAWVKYFLAPLQDRQFLVGGTVHHLPQCLFVFAGGVSASVDEFQAAVRKGREASSSEGKEYRTAKLPDFETRLKAFYTVPRIVPEGHGTDEPLKTTAEGAFDLFVARASLLHTLIQKHAPGALRVDRDLATALLLCSRYDVAREVERLFEASTLAGADLVTWSALPPGAHQLLDGALRRWREDRGEERERERWEKLGKLLELVRDEG